MELIRDKGRKLLKVQNLKCYRENKTLFSDLTFALDTGAWLQVRGANGSGKSSLLKILVGLTQALGGEIFWYSDLSIRVRNFQDFIYLGHKTGIQTHLTVFENLKWWLAIRELETQMQTTSDSINTINQALKYWEIEALNKVSCDRLSAGQCQRVALARLKLNKSKLWVLDEPCNALDAKAVLLFEKLLAKHLDNGGSAIIVSHLPLHLPSHEDRKAILDMGVLQKQKRDIRSLQRVENGVSQKSSKCI